MPFLATTLHYYYFQKTPHQCDSKITITAVWNINIGANYLLDYRLIIYL